MFPFFVNWFSWVTTVQFLTNQPELECTLPAGPLGFWGLSLSLCSEIAWDMFESAMNFWMLLVCFSWLLSVGVLFGTVATFGLFCSSTECIWYLLCGFWFENKRSTFLSLPVFFFESFSDVSTCSWLENSLVSRSSWDGLLTFACFYQLISQCVISNLEKVFMASLVFCWLIATMHASRVSSNSMQLEFFWPSLSVCFQTSLSLRNFKLIGILKFFRRSQSYCRCFILRRLLLSGALLGSCNQSSVQLLIYGILCFFLPPFFGPMKCSRECY